MNNVLSQAQKIRQRKAIINIDRNAQIKEYQRKLVALSFARESADASKEYEDIVNKIKILRGTDEADLH